MLGVVALGKGRGRGDGKEDYREDGTADLHCDLAMGGSDFLSVRVVEHDVVTVVDIMVLTDGVHEGMVRGWRGGRWKVLYLYYTV